MSWATNGLTSSKSVGKEIEEDVGDSIRILISELLAMQEVLETGHELYSSEVLWIWEYLYS
ncbi:hypothetical protein V6Z11_A02G026400 [Gossypium hirsutum]